MINRLLSLTIIILVIFLSACSSNKSGQGGNTSSQDAESGTVPNEEEEESIAAWTVYWDTNIQQELSNQGKSIGTLCYFAAYFKEDDSLFLPEKSKETYNEINLQYGKDHFITYLTFVNDIEMNDESSKLKNTDLLYRLFETKSSREKHISDIISMALKDGFQGIEIDYEAIRKDNKLWSYFSIFADELYQEASENGLLVRILLEPNAPLDDISLPQGPEYVIMCYNLYGYGTEPGPKANKEFLEKMVQKMKKLDSVNYALATGGFDFLEDGTVAQLTEDKAVLTRKEAGVEIQRDEDSRCIVFTYNDKDGKKHEVWYADKETIDYWIQVLKDNGAHRISLWRLGGDVTVFGNNR